MLLERIPSSSLTLVGKKVIAQGMRDLQKVDEETLQQTLDFFVVMLHQVRHGATDQNATEAESEFLASLDEPKALAIEGDVASE